MIGPGRVSALGHGSGSSMNIDSPHFGKLEFELDQVLEFPEGLLGFPNLTRFLRFGPKDFAPIEFLLPLAEPKLRFPVLSPYLVRTEYDLPLSEAERHALGLAENGSLTVFCVANLTHRVEDATVNLLAPILINPDNRRGRQVVLEASGYSVTEPLFAGELHPA